MAPKVIDKDMGYAKAMKSLSDFGNLVVTVGIHATAEPYRRGQAEPINVAQVAAVHEFGGGNNVPARPFMRPAVDGNRSKYAGIVQRDAGRILDGVRTVAQMAHTLASSVISDVQRSIDAVVSPPIKEATLKKKQAVSKTGNVRIIDGVETGNPLIDTGHMKQSVTGEVRTGGRVIPVTI